MSQPILVRTLSSQHWEAAEIEMSRKKCKQIYAGGAGNWTFRLSRKNSKTNQAYRETLFEGVKMYCCPVSLPRPIRCRGTNSDGSRCHKRSYGQKCEIHC